MWDDRSDFTRGCVFRAKGARRAKADAQVQGLLESKDTHHPEGGSMLLGIALL